jgi:3',5'-cyclic AMP phosphodiesterase CpdA
LALGAFVLVAGPASATAYRFVSAPDSWNNDIGDVRSAVGWDRGEPNSVNPSWRRAINAVVDEIAAREPRFVLVAGDTVEGEWDEDVDGLGTFGSTADLAGKRRAIRAAARIYYPQWQAPFARRDMRIHAALGDHEIGDNWWNEPDERALVPTFRRAWAKHFTLRGRRSRFVYANHPPAGTQHATTAYAFRSGPALFVTVDTFHQRRSGVVHTEIVGTQLRWLRRVLSRAHRDPTVTFVIVQGHAPVLRPFRAVGSSELTVMGGERSAFWRTLEANGVDLYLSGEMHAISAASHGGVEQVVHGSTLAFGRYNYLTVAVSPERLVLTVRETRMVRNKSSRLWQVGDKRPPASIRVGRFSFAGTMTITADGSVRDRTGRLRRYVQGDHCAPARPHR